MNKSKNIELISFKICPFVQRSVIALNEKGVDFKTTYIDLEDLPEWFKAISPLGKVPVLKVGDIAIFESMVIAEYLDEVYAPSLHPQEPLEKARHRSWIEYSSELIMSQYFMFAATDEKAFNTKKIALCEQLEKLNDQLSTSGDFFAGTDFSLIDAAYAPLFMRIELFEKYYPLELYKKGSRLDKWSKALMKKEAVKNSVSADFDNAFLDYFSADNYFAKHLFETASEAS